VIGGVRTVITAGTRLTPTEAESLRYEGTAEVSFMFSATDSFGNTSLTDGTVDLRAATVNPPDTQNASFQVSPGTTIDLTEPAGVDNIPFFSIPLSTGGNLPSGSDDAALGTGTGTYRIETIPIDGQLFVGPVTAPTLITGPTDLTPAQFGMLFFEADAGFTGSQFEFSITDAGTNMSLRNGVVSLGVAVPPPSSPLPPPSPLPDVDFQVEASDRTPIPDGTLATFGFPGQPTEPGDSVLGSGLREPGGNGTQGGIISDFSDLQCIVGESVTQIFRIVNPGPRELLVESISVPEGFELVGNFSRFGVAPGATFEFPVRFTPTTSGVFSGNVVIQTNRTGDPFYNFPIAAKALAATPVDQRFPGLEVDRPEDCPPPPEAIGFSMAVPIFTDQPEVVLRDAPTFDETVLGDDSADDLLSSISGLPKIRSLPPNPRNRVP
ncbi:MAG: hypothetical protein AAGF75_12070, partial [Cyanobacteria bacterium P01_H01_bin.130]